MKRMFLLAATVALFAVPSAGFAASAAGTQTNPSDTFFQTVNNAVDQSASAIPAMDPDGNVVAARR